MIKLISIILLISMGFCSYSNAQNAIELRMTNCLDKVEGQTTKGMIMCIEEARKEWLVYIQHHIDQLTLQLDSTQLSILLQSQSSWEQYYRDQLEFINNYYSHKKGSIWKTVAATQGLEVARMRATSLAYFIEPKLETPDK